MLDDIRDRFTQGVLSAQDVVRRTREEVDALLQTARRQAEAQGVSLDAAPPVVDMTPTPSSWQRALQVAGAVVATGLVVSGTSILLVALAQLFAAFFIMTRLLGIRLDFGAVAT